MHTNHKIHFKTAINAPLEKVWEALTNPEIVKQYFFGTELLTDWVVGNAIIFQGDWEGKPYQDKGIILEYMGNQKLAYSYLSNWSGLEDSPDNYLWVCYEVNQANEGTEVTISQSNYDEERAKHTNENWASIMGEMKKSIE